MGEARGAAADGGPHSALPSRRSDAAPACRRSSLRRQPQALLRAAAPTPVPRVRRDRDQALLAVSAAEGVQHPRGRCAHVRRRRWTRAPALERAHTLARTAADGRSSGCRDATPTSGTHMWTRQRRSAGTPLAARGSGGLQRRSSHGRPLRGAPIPLGPGAAKRISKDPAMGRLEALPVLVRDGGCLQQRRVQHAKSQQQHKQPRRHGANSDRARVVCQRPTAMSRRGCVAAIRLSPRLCSLSLSRCSSHRSSTLFSQFALFIARPPLPSHTSLVLRFCLGLSACLCLFAAMLFVFVPICLCLFTALLSFCLSVFLSLFLSFSFSLSASLCHARSLAFKFRRAQRHAPK